MAGQPVGELARPPAGRAGTTASRRRDTGSRSRAHAPKPSRHHGRGGNRTGGPVAPRGIVAEQVGATDVAPPRDQQLVGREARDHLAAGRGDDDLLLDPRRRAAVGRCAVGLQREDHPLLERDGVVERVHPRDHRRLVQADADAVPELESEAGLLVREAELLGGRPDRGDPVRRHPGPDERDRGIEPLAAPLVRVELRGADTADVERAVVARSVAHERVDDVEERLVARPQQPVGEDVRMRVAAVARDGVHRLHLLGAHLEEQLVRPRHDLVLVHARAEHAVDLLVDGIDEPGRLVEERDLLRCLDLAGLQHDARAVRDVHAGSLERLERDEVGHVDAERLAGDPVLAHLVRDPCPEPVGDSGLDGHRAAHRRHAGAEVLGRKPGSEELVVARGGAEVPEDRVGAAWEEHEAGVLVACPLADVRARDVADVVRIEEKERAEIGRLERRLRALEPVGTKAREVDPLLPVHRARRVGRAHRPVSHRHRRTS